MMKQKTDLKNKTDNSKLPDNNNIINLVEEVEKPQDEEDIIVLKEEIQVVPEENDGIIDLTDEVSMASQEASAKTTDEIMDAAIERIILKLFAGKIDFMVREAIKKVLAEDIEKLHKQILHQQEEKA
jgi:hypothetical protein